jgi:hypothetical protein
VRLDHGTRHPDRHRERQRRRQRSRGDGARRGEAVEEAVAPPAPVRTGDRLLPHRRGRRLPLEDGHQLALAVAEPLVAHRDASSRDLSLRRARWVATRAAPSVMCMTYAISA